MADPGGDIDQKRAQRLGAEAVVLSADPVQEVRAVTGGGAHASLDALGAPATAVASVRSLRRRGRHVQVGLLLDPAGTALPMDLVVAHELELYGSHGMPARAYPEMLEMIAAGVLSPQKLIAKTVSLAEVGAELEAMGGFAQRGVTVIDLNL